MKNYHTEVYVADFETSTEKDKTWIWAFGYSRIFTNKIHYGSSIKEFLEIILRGRSKKIYFHNLKFDGKFIIYYLLANGYTMVEECKKLNEFSGIVDDTGTFYSIKIPFQNAKGGINYATINDSLKLFPTSIAKAAVDYGLEYRKGELDYDKIRYEGHIMNKEEEEYLQGDIVILRSLIEIAVKSNFKKLTIAGVAFSTYKQQLESKDVEFTTLFPTLSDIEYGFIKKAYRGGVSMVNSKYRNKVTTTNSYDVNSMYPFILRYFQMPYGKPRYFKGKYVENDIYPLYIQHIRSEFYIKDGKAPCIQIHGNMNFLHNEWIKNCPLTVDLYLTNADLKMFMNSYNIISIEYIDGYMFKGAQGFFTEYVDKYYQIKCNSKGEPKAKAKLMLNSLYGKFGMKSERTSILYSIEDKKLVKSGEYTNEVKTIYLPIAVFTTSYARYYLLTYINKHYEDFIYCDTDSIHLTKRVNDIPQDNKKLGYFKHEYSGIGKYLKQKCYIVKYDKEYIHKDDDGEDIDTKIVCAGLNKNMIDTHMSIEDFKYGAELHKLKAKNIEGGVALIVQPHIITEPMHSIIPQD